MNMKNITIVGVGALGSHVALLLRNVEASIKVIDFDRVEQKNTQSQFHGKPNVGKLKVQSLSAVMQMLFGIKIATISSKLTVDNADQLLSSTDLILDCLDNVASRQVVRAHALRAQIPCLHGALAPGGQFGRVVWSECFTIDSEVGIGAATCEDGEHLPFIAITASHLAHAAQTFLKTNRKVGFEINPGGVFRT